MSTRLRAIFIQMKTEDWNSVIYFWLSTFWVLSTCQITLTFSLHTYISVELENNLSQQLNLMHQHNKVIFEYLHSFILSCIDQFIPKQKINTLYKSSFPINYAFSLSEMSFDGFNVVVLSCSRAWLSEIWSTQFN